MTDRSENNLTAILEHVAKGHYEAQAAQAEDWPTWDEVSKVQKQALKSALLPTVMLALDFVDAEPHQPKRGNDVEAWVKARRDECDPHGGAWLALDDMLDDYRLRSDTGADLTTDVIVG